MKRARGAQVTTKSRKAAVENHEEQDDTVLASEVQIGDLIWFDQAAKPSEVIAISEEQHGEVSVRRISSADSSWLIPVDQSVRKQPA